MKLDCKRFALLILSILALFPSCKKKDDTLSSSGKIQEFRIALHNNIVNFDPRLANNPISINIAQLLYEGLTRYDKDNIVKPALADKIDISPDGRTYTFHLRKSYWSNGDELTADDFEYTWKSILNPENDSKNAFHLFWLENAKLSYEGRAPEDTIGVRALNDSTLEVRLQKPNSHFLELLTLPVFFPIHQEWEEEHLDWKEDDHPSCLGNGPFYLERISSKTVLRKNPKYWDEVSVNFKEVHLEPLSEQEAIDKFKDEKLDWVGSPTMTFSFSAIEKLKNESLLNTTDAAATQFIRINTAIEPLTNENIRKALSHAIDRRGISEKYLLGTEVGTYSLVPACFGAKSEVPYVYMYDQEQAQEFFLKGSEALSMKHENMPELTLSYAAGDHTTLIANAIKQNWKDTLAIEVKLEALSRQDLYVKLKNGNYQLALCSWFAEYMDPMSFLSLFAKKDNKMNFTAWANRDYQRYISKLMGAKTASEKIELLNRAQDILQEEAPIIPLFSYTFNYLKAKNLQGVKLSPLGLLSIKEGKIE